MRQGVDQKFDCAVGCSVEAALTLIGGKWKGVILYRLLTEEVLRFNALRRFLPSITQRMLTNQLRELEQDGLIDRKVYAEVPPKVEYRLTPLGNTLAPLINMLKSWGDYYVETRADQKKIEMNSQDEAVIS